MPAVNAIRPSIPLPELPEVGAAKGGDFRSLMENAIGQVEQYRANASQSVENFLAGEGEELHSVVLSAQRAELALELFLQARNKVVQAYQEIMRMQM